MGMLYKVTDKVWGISDMPWPFFYGIQAFVILKLIIGTVILCFVTLTYPFLYGFGIWYLIKKKKKPNWFYFAVYTALMGWYVFVIVRYGILSYPMPQYSGWPGGNQSLNQHPTEQIYEIKKTPNGEEYTPDKVYNYHIKIDDAANTLETSNIQRGWRDEPPLKMSTSQIKKLNGVYEWQSNIFFETQRQMFDYICEHFSEMQKYKVGSASIPRKSAKSYKHTNIYDEYQDRLDDYLDDPEDEITFNPEIFNFQDD